MVVLTAPINYHWQNWLERAFPGWKTEKKIRDACEGEEEKGMILLREDGGGGKGIVEEEVRVRNWWNIFRKWFTDVSVFFFSSSIFSLFVSLSFFPRMRGGCLCVCVCGWWANL